MNTVNEGVKEGTIFEIREFSLFDGPGIRTTVFLKGCPLRCLWCHNPEGIRPERELLVNKNRCTNCGACRTCCDRKECIVCGRCVEVCGQGCRRIVGRKITADELVMQLLKQQDIFASTGGGVTFSGGDPVFQSDFTIAVCQKLHEKGIHCAVETSGFASLDQYRAMTENVDLVLQDLKHPDPKWHKQYTGQSNEPILRNLEWLKTSGKPFIIRIPLIPGVNTQSKWMEQFSLLLTDSSSLIRVELLPYHPTAGAKYHLLGLEYRFTLPKESETESEANNATGNKIPDLTPFETRGIPVRVM